MRAEFGHALLYVDLSSAEFGIAAALGGDQSMMDDYRGGDPYLSLGKRMGFLPCEATRETHREMRELLKTVCLGAQYGMGSETLALHLGCPGERAGDLLALHRKAYPVYWRYTETILEVAKFERQLWTSLDWRLNDAHLANANSVKNFPMQATCADILRLTCCLAVEAGLEVIAPFHDALLIHTPTEQVDDALELTRSCWTRASAALLNGFALRCDTSIEKAVFSYPEHFRDGRDADFFDKALAFVAARHLEIQA